MQTRAHRSRALWGDSEISNSRRKKKRKKKTGEGSRSCYLIWEPEAERKREKHSGFFLSPSNLPLVSQTPGNSSCCNDHLHLVSQSSQGRVRMELKAKRATPGHWASLAWAEPVFHSATMWQQEAMAEGD